MKRYDRSDEYFNRSVAIVADTPRQTQLVRYRVFARQTGVLSGINRAVRFIRENATGPLRIQALRDGDRFFPEDPVMVLEGGFGQLVGLETIYLGMLSYSGGASRMDRIVEAAGGIPVIDMSARHYPPEIIEQVAYAAAVGGAAGTSTKTGADYVLGQLGTGDGRIRVADGPARPFQLYGSIPHALNAVFGGDSVATAEAYAERLPEVPLTLLTDFEGRELDVCRAAYRRLGDRLFAVRLDTDLGRLHQGGHTEPVPELVDRILSGAEDAAVVREALDRHGFGPGVTIEAVYNVRACLDAVGATDTRILVSSGFDEEKTAAFVACKAPLDAIGTGSWMSFLMFTSDIVAVFEERGWVPRSKAGRVPHADPFEHPPLLFERSD